MKISFILKNTLMVLSMTSIIGCAELRHQESTGQYIDSSVITTKVKSNLLSDKQIKALPIKVVTYKNKVQLSGFVDTPYQKKHAEEITQQVEGVEYVENDLIIKKH